MLAGERVPLVVVGPTASGKSAAALELIRRGHADGGAATQMPSEVVSADSMGVYRGMNIGTAKPTAAEQAEVPHHLIDLVDPSERFTVVDYAAAFDTVMSDLASRDERAVLVGGSGLYLRAVIDGLTPPPEFPQIAAELEAEAAEMPTGDGAHRLHKRLAELDPLAASRMQPSNLRRVVRALSVCIGTGRTFSSCGPGLHSYPEVPCLIVGIDVDRDTLDRRIAERFERQLEQGFLDEVRRLTSTLPEPQPTAPARNRSPTPPDAPQAQPPHTPPTAPHAQAAGPPAQAAGPPAQAAGPHDQQEPTLRAAPQRAPLSHTAAQALGYKELRAHLAGECSLGDARELAIARIRRFARRQQRWFARDPRIIWIPHSSDAEVVERLVALVVGGVGGGGGRRLGVTADVIRAGLDRGR